MQTNISLNRYITDHVVVSFDHDTNTETNTGTPGSSSEPKLLLWAPNLDAELFSALRVHSWGESEGGDHVRFTWLFVSHLYFFIPTIFYLRGSAVNTSSRLQTNRLVTHSVWILFVLNHQMRRRFSLHKVQDGSQKSFNADGQQGATPLVAKMSLILWKLMRKWLEWKWSGR